MITAGVFEGRNFNINLDNPLYKQTNLSNICGVYAIYKLNTNLQTDTSFYIGSSNNVLDRHQKHFNRLRNNCHDNIYLQNSWNKYGEDSFIMFLLEECDEQNQFEREQNWIDFYRYNYPNHKILFNIQNLAQPFSNQRKENISFGNKGKSRNRGIKRPNSVLLALSRKHKGKKRTLEDITKQKQTIKNRKLGLYFTEKFGKRIRQIDKENNQIIRIWPSIKLASKILNITETGITHVLKTSIGIRIWNKSRNRYYDQKTAGGFKWEYAIEQEYQDWKSKNEVKNQ